MEIKREIKKADEKGDGAAVSALTAKLTTAKTALNKTEEKVLVKLTKSAQQSAALVAKAGDAVAELAALTGDAARKKELEAYLWGREVIDFLLAYPGLSWSAEEFVKALRKPRATGMNTNQVHQLRR